MRRFVYVLTHRFLYPRVQMLGHTECPPHTVMVLGGIFEDYLRFGLYIGPPVFNSDRFYNCMAVRLNTLRLHAGC